MSSTMSVVPIPGLDFGVDLKLMKDIIEDVNKIYGLDHKQVNSLGDDVKERIMSAAAIQGSQFIGKRISNAFLKIVIRDVAKRTAAKQTKWFPVVGQAVSASISYYFMNKIGKDHIQKWLKMLLKMSCRCYKEFCNLQILLKPVLNELNLKHGFGKVNV